MLFTFRLILLKLAILLIRINHVHLFISQNKCLDRLMFNKIMYSDRYILKNYSNFCYGPQFMVVVQYPTGSILIYSLSMQATLLEGWDLFTSMVL